MKKMVIVGTICLLVVVGPASAELIFYHDFNVSGDIRMSETPPGTYHTQGWWDEGAGYWWHKDKYNYALGATWEPRWATRDLRGDAGTHLIGDNEVIENPTLSWDAWMHWGTNTNNLLYFASRITDDDGNGYYGIQTRAGTMKLYRLDAGVATEIASSTDGIPGNARRLTFSIIDGIITISSEFGSLSASDSTYSQFTRVSVGGVVWNEVIYQDNVELDATVVAVPEPATIILLLASSLVGLIRRRT